MQYARFSRDVLSPSREIINQASPESLSPDQWEAQIHGLKEWHGTAKRIQNANTEINSFVAMTQAVTNTVVSGVVTVWPQFPAGQSIPPAVENARVSLFQTLQRFPLVEQALASMRRLGLDSRGGGSKSPFMLLEEARSAIERPSVQEGGEVGILISLRECIDASVTELIRRRPKQEEVTGGWKGKVASLGQHCARPSLALGHFDRVGVEIDAILNELSGSKQSKMPRERLLEKFNRGVLSLNALLSGIDEGKLRPS